MPCVFFSALCDLMQKGSLHVRPPSLLKHAVVKWNRIANFGLVLLFFIVDVPQIL